MLQDLGDYDMKDRKPLVVSIHVADEPPEVRLTTIHIKRSIPKYKQVARFERDYYEALEKRKASKAVNDE